MILLVLILFVLGLFIGSFLLVLIDRLPRNESVIKGRSHCEHCHHVLAWYDLIPIISFLLLQGKCRYCHKRLSLYYPILEILTGLVFTSTIFLVVPYSTMLIVVQLLFYLIVFSSFLVIFFTDIKYGIIPDVITFFAVAITFLYLLLLSPPLLINHVFSAIGAVLLFYLLYIITKKRGMGFGDVKLVAWLGLLLGFPDIAIALYIAFIVGAVVSLLLILMHRKHFHGSTIAFGPFLVLGAYLALFFGSELLYFVQTLVLH